MIARVLEKAGATVWARGIVYKVVDQSVLLYSSESWVMMGEVLKVLEGFHHQAARRITGMMVTYGVGKEWEYPLVVTALEDAILNPIREYISRQQETIAENVACRPIYEICNK